MKERSKKQWCGGMVLCAAGILGLFLSGCSQPLGGSVDGGKSITYSGTAGNKTYTLVIYESGDRAVYTPKKGDRYELTINPGNAKSVGTVTNTAGTNFTLKPGGSGAAFTVTAAVTESGSGGITAISGTITLTDGKTTPAPARVTPIGSTSTNTGSNNSGGGGGGGGGSGGGGGGGTRYTITFNSHGGSAVTAITANAGTQISAPEAPTKEECRFLGWFADENGSTKYTWPHTLNASVTMHARWAMQDTVSTVDELQSLLKNHTSNGPNDPIWVKIQGISLLGEATSGWLEILRVIGDEKKYLDLDLSECSMDTSGVFILPERTAITGEAYITGLVLPDTAAKIEQRTAGYASFWEFQNLRTLNASGLEEVGAFVFLGCKSLNSVELPALTTIYDRAFAFCRNLTEISLPASLNLIAGNPFVGCVNLRKISIAPNSPYTARDGMLLKEASGETALLAYPSASGNVTLNSVTAVGDSAFADCTSLTMVDLPKAVLIGGGAFYECTSLNSVSLTTAVSIDGSAFAYCTSLTRVDLPKAASIDYGAFGETGTQPLTIILGATPPAVGTDLFYGVTNKYVDVLVPSGAMDYDTSNWIDAFRGNASINLSIYYTL
jgi:hypothetical protein